MPWRVCVQTGRGRHLNAGFEAQRTPSSWRYNSRLAVLHVSCSAPLQLEALMLPAVSFFLPRQFRMARAGELLCLAEPPSPGTSDRQLSSTEPGSRW